MPGPEPDCSWVVPFRTAGAKPPLFCACALGGDVFDYRDLAAALDADQPIYAFGVPGGGEGGRLRTVEQIAEAYLPKVRQLQPHGPYHLCGHSFGGLVVYEMAARLARDGEAIGLIALFDTEHPAYSRILPPKQQAEFRATYFKDRLRKYAANFGSGRIDSIASDIVRFSRARLKRASFRAAHALFGALGLEIPKRISSHQLILSAAWRAYTPREYPGRVVLFLAADRPVEYRAERTLGWGSCVTGALELQTVPGDHFSMLHPPLVATLASRMAPFLGRTARADRQMPGGTGS